MRQTPPTQVTLGGACVGNPALERGMKNNDDDVSNRKIVWECNNGGQLWDTPAEATSSNGTMPSGLCSAGFHSLYIAFVFSLALDFILQVYAFFMCWRFKKRIEHYYALATKESNIYSF